MERTWGCRIHWEDHTQIYTVYDRFGSIMIRTGSRAAAAEYLALAERGISAQLHYWLERWNYRVPVYIADQIRER